MANNFSQKKRAGGSIEWIDDEVIGYNCECGQGKGLLVSIYEDEPYGCPACGRLLLLKQTSVVFEVGYAPDGYLFQPEDRVEARIEGG